MRALQILQEPLDRSLHGVVHRKQSDAVWRAVAGLLGGGRLWLTALGRSLPGETSDKHRIKAADRLLGSHSLHVNLRRFYGALAARLLRRTKSPVIVVDWTSLGTRHYALCAQLCFDGRTLPIYSRVWEKSFIGNPVKQGEFLRELATVLPRDCKPVIITDAGFRSTWFDAVAKLGWDFVGRVRNRTHILLDGRWVGVRAVHALARNRPKNLGRLWVGRTRTRRHRIVLAQRPVLKGRQRLTRSGTKGRRKEDRQRSKGAREPWLLATSLQCNPESVVHIYRMRMQIEQSLRDAKNHRHGWSLRHVGCKSTERIETLLMIAALAMVVANAVGRAATDAGMHRAFQANTIRSRRVLSFFVLGLYVLNSRCFPLATAAVMRAWKAIPLLIDRNGACAATK